MCGRTFRKRRRNKLGIAPIDVKDIYVLSKWMGEKGFKPVKRLRPKIFCESGRGLMAEEVIRPGDVIISIPQNLLVTPKSVLSSYLGTFFEKYYPKATGHEILSVFLMCEKAKGKSSEWLPYIASLPQTYSIPVYFCQHAFTIMPKPVYTLAIKQCESVENSFSQLNILLTELKNTYPFFKDVIDYDLYKWAWSSVNTRSIFIECGYKDCCGKLCTYHLALAPYLDLLNHSTDVQVVANLNKENSCYEITSLNKFKKYSQVFINYGCHGNRKLFLEYGFVIPGNYNDSIAFSFDDIILAYEFCGFPSKGLSKKLKFIKDNNLLKNAVCSSDGISWNLNILLKILISEYDIKLWNSLLHKDANQIAGDSEFQKIKQCLLSLKTEEYKLNSSASTCLSKCSSQQCVGLVFNLHMIENSLLIKELS